MAGPSPARHAALAQIAPCGGGKIVVDAGVPPLMAPTRELEMVTGDRTIDDPAPPGGHYSHAVRSGDLVFVSGQLGARADGTHTAHLPFEDQARQAMANLFVALRSAGAGRGDIVKVTAYIVDVANWPRFDAVYAELMAVAKPARAVVPVPELHHGYLIEIEAIAVGGSHA